MNRKRRNIEREVGTYERGAMGLARAWAAKVMTLAIPACYLQSKRSRRELVKVFGVAAAIRLLLMPFATHADLISTYHRSFRLLSSFHPRSWVPHELVQAAALELYRFVLPLEELLAWQGGPTASVEFWLGSFATHPKVHLALFLFKLPYLIFDLAVALVFLRLWSESAARGVKAVGLWLLNPITIFTFYVFGRHDVITIFFIVLALLYLQRSKPLRGAFAIGLAIWSRYYALLFLPFLAVLDRSSWPKKAKMFMVALAPVTAYNLLTVLTQSDQILPIVSLARSRFAKFPLGAKLEIGWIQEIYLYPLVLGILILFASTLEGREGFVVRFSAWCCAALLLFYALSIFHPQYFTWFIPFLVVLRSDGEDPVLARLHYLQILLFVAYTFYWGEPLFGYLLASLDPEFFTNLAAPADVIEKWLPANMILGVIRSLLSASCVFMAGWVLFTRHRHLWSHPTSTQ